MRIDSYESKEAQKHVRSLLEGRFENSAFVILAPDGKKWLTTAGRGPNQVLGGSPRHNQSKIDAMTKIADSYEERGKRSDALLQDFHSFGQALNVASADQRILVVLHGEGEALTKARESVRAIAASDEMVGRFHFDSSPKKGWTENVTKLEDKPGIHLIIPGEFGLKGALHQSLPLDGKPKMILAALKKANAHYAETEKRKSYFEHVSKGRQGGVRIESAVPFGEDRDGDGKIDPRRR